MSEDSKIVIQEMIKAIKREARKNSMKPAELFIEFSKFMDLTINPYNSKILNIVSKLRGFFQDSCTVFGVNILLIYPVFLEQIPKCWKTMETKTKKQIETTRFKTKKCPKVMTGTKLNKKGTLTGKSTRPRRAPNTKNGMV